MKFLYKIHSGYDGFTPARIPNRMTDGRHLDVGWDKYIEALDLGDEVWIYFHGPQRFENGVYLRGQASAIDFSARRVRLRVLSSSIDAPITDPATSARVAEIVAPRYRQVFLFPEALVTTPACSLATTAKSCGNRLCGGCETWESLYKIDPATLRRPERFGEQPEVFAPAFWVIPSRCYLGSRPGNHVRKTTELFKRFKTGESRLAFPLALAMLEATNKAGSGFGAIVPIPLSPDKEARGELDRAGALAAEIGLLTNTPVIRAFSLAAPISKHTVGGSKATFERAYKDATVLDRAALAGKTSVLLVDDVCTHGSHIRILCDALTGWQPDLRIGATTAGQMILKATVRDEVPLLRTSGA